MTRNCFQSRRAISCRIRVKWVATHETRYMVALGLAFQVSGSRAVHFYHHKCGRTDGCRPLRIMFKQGSNYWLHSRTGLCSATRLFPNCAHLSSQRHLKHACKKNMDVDQEPKLRSRRHISCKDCTDNTTCVGATTLATKGTICPKDLLTSEGDGSMIHNVHLLVVVQ